MLDSPLLRAGAIAFGVVVLLPLFWCFVVWLLSRLSGWGRLSKRYESNRRFEGDTLKWQSARFGLINYNGVLTVTQMEDGLGFAPFPLFSAGHLPLLIPWNAITYQGPKRSLFADMEIYHIALANASSVRLALKAGLLQRERLDPVAPSH